jgi:heat shock protein HslJ
MVIGSDRNGATYKATDDGALMLPSIMITEKDCETPQGVMQQEQVYIKALRDVVTYRIANDRLELDNGAGETILLFTREQ